MTMVLPPPPSGGPARPGGPPQYPPTGLAPALQGPSAHSAPGASPQPGQQWSGQHQPGQHQQPGTPWRPYPPATRWVWSLVGGVVAIAVLIATWRVFIVTARPRLVDQAAFLGSEAGRAALEPVAQLILGVVSIPFLVGAIVVAVTIALLRRQWGDAARAAVIVIGANLTTQVLKQIVERPFDEGVPDSGYGNSLPSGHTTVAASVAAVALLVVPRRARPVVAILGATYAAATGVATMSLGWHRPSDAIAAFAVVAAWTLLMLVPTRGRPADGYPGTAGRVLAAWLLVIVAVVGLTVGILTLLVSWRTAGTDLSGSSAVLTTGAMRLAYVGAASGVVGASALSSWAILLARR